MSLSYLFFFHVVYSRFFLKIGNSQRKQDHNIRETIHTKVQVSPNKHTVQYLSFYQILETRAFREKNTHPTRQGKHSQDKKNIKILSTSFQLRSRRCNTELDN